MNFIKKYLLRGKAKKEALILLKEVAIKMLDFIEHTEVNQGLCVIYISLMVDKNLPSGAIFVSAFPILCKKAGIKPLGTASYYWWHGVVEAHTLNKEEWYAPRIAFLKSILLKH